ncbi:MAG TPA: hypothetical protein EYH54_00435 [Nautiliaceae bacterium]|nr:hypothetical protein [Nautiliaceae bacterium]
MNTLKKPVYIIVLVLFLGLVALFFLIDNKKEPKLSNLGNEEIKENNVKEVVEIRLEAYQWGWEPSEIRVPYGAKVRLIITTRDVLHGIYIPDLGIKADIKPGEETVLEFEANKKGTFKFVCSVYCGIGHRDMVGTLIIE